VSATIGLIDYGSGNLRSVGKALEQVHASVRLVEKVEDLEGVSAMVLPGVGAFGDCVRQLKERGLWEPVGEWVRADRPFLGICLGYQMLFDSSEESPGVAGLGVFSGAVRRFRKAAELGLKVPHMGWNSLDLVNREGFWSGLPESVFVYFVHSYFPEPDDSSLVAAWCEHGERFAAAVTRGRLVATQFHPEKSQGIGLRLLENFVKSI